MTPALVHERDGQEHDGGKGGDLRSHSADGEYIPEQDVREVDA